MSQEQGSMRKHQLWEFFEQTSGGVKMAYMMNSRYSIVHSSTVYLQYIYWPPRNYMGLLFLQRLTYNYKLSCQCLLTYRCVFLIITVTNFLHDSSITSQRSHRFIQSTAVVHSIRMTLFYTFVVLTYICEQRHNIIDAIKKDLKQIPSQEFSNIV